MYLAYLCATDTHRNTYIKILIISSPIYRKAEVRMDTYPGGSDSVVLAPLTFKGLGKLRNGFVLAEPNSGLGQFRVS
eukprot:1371048-Amorphochlora_amoeboformis.AAC.1